MANILDIADAIHEYVHVSSLLICFMLIIQQFGISFTRERRVVCQHSSTSSDFDVFDTMGVWKGFEDPRLEISLLAELPDATGMVDLSFCEIGAWKGGVAICSQPLYNGHWMEEMVSYKLHSCRSHVTRHTFQVPDIMHTWITWHTQYIGVAYNVRRVTCNV
jgi:hypothetical protein